MIPMMPWCTLETHYYIYLVRLDPPLKYMYIVVQCGLSSIVEYGTTISVLDCVKFSVLVNQCVRPSCSLGGYTYPQKKTKPDTQPVS
jgi:hypothetical protein